MDDIIQVGADLCKMLEETLLFTSGAMVSVWFFTVGLDHNQSDFFLISDLYQLNLCESLTFLLFVTVS